MQGCRVRLHNIMNLTLEKDLGSSHRAYAVVFGIVFLLGLPLNAVSLWILVRHHMLKSPSAVFMTNLALADLLLVLTLPMRVYFYATGTWPLGIQACVWFSMLFRNNIRASVIFITFIGVDRLLAVVFPLRARHLRTTTNTWRVCGLVWLSLLAVNIPESVGFIRNMYQCNQTTCFEISVCAKSKVQIYMQSSLVLISLAVNVVTTSMVFWKLHQLRDLGQPAANRINVMLIFVMNFLMFVVFFLPASLVVLVDSRVVMPTLCLASINCCFDPLLYYFSLDSFWMKKDQLDSSLK